VSSNKFQTYAARTIAAAVVLPTFSNAHHHLEEACWAAGRATVQCPAHNDLPAHGPGHAALKYQTIISTSTAMPSATMASWTYL
jgi:hypothetical protein